MPAPQASSQATRVRVAIFGAVQGVGFRPFVFNLAQELGLAGWVSNTAEGVLIEAEGPEAALREFLHRLDSGKPKIAIVQSLEATFLDAVGLTGFEIRESSGGDKRVLVMPDLATCQACLVEVFDPRNRRYRYPFTNCTTCGPRYSIIAALPYDRAATTMRGFTMCADCEREYHDPTNRRFHAQPNACPACGPHLALWGPAGTELAIRYDALLRAATAIREGKVVAVKGLGGFHLMVDARNDDAVKRLRERKRREEKPFALMVPSFTEALRYCTASEGEQRLLRSPEAPIVILPRRHLRSAIAPAVAPGNPTLGVMLPSTPLHHLLLRELDFPVVATSGNLSEEPLCIDEREALTRLAGIADLFLVHDRPILRHVDDSIVREVAGRELVLRRARGFAPLPVTLPSPSPPVLAVGAHQKNTIAAAVGTQAFISQHIGDLESEGAREAFRQVIAAFERLYDFAPGVVACDLHPDYASTQYAAGLGLPLRRVQHHQAHVLSCMAENGLAPPVLGIAWDGSGLGEDGTVWGGEFLHLTGQGWQRMAHLRPFLLPGNEKAVREPRRTALALLYEVFGPQAIVVESPAVMAFTPAELATMRTMLDRQLNSPLTSSVGRLFDGFASLLGLRHVVSFEGQAAMELEYAIGGTDEASLPYAIGEENGRFVLDWEPAVRAVLAKPDPAVAAIQFHNMLVEMAVDVAKRVGEPNVALSGGCFQNRYLTERMIARLRAEGLRPYWHQRVPPNDGGVALGQLVATLTPAG